MPFGRSQSFLPVDCTDYDRIFQVKEFTEGYMLLREMGFSSNNVAEALLMYDNDTDKALAHFLNSTS